jgi:hypothetical protein
VLRIISTDWKAKIWKNHPGLILLTLLKNGMGHYIMLFGLSKSGLGLDYGSLLVSRKIIDVMSFSGEDGIIFGKSCFQKEGETKLREVLEYSADGIMTLRFHNKKTIVFDHLVPISSGQKYDQDNYGSEFSYDAYIYNKGLWRFVRNVDIRSKQ